MRVNQYVYFAVRSGDMTGEQMTARLGVQADETVIRGSRQTEPPVPVCHVWRVVCRKPDMTVDEQIDEVIGRLEPVAGRIRELAAELDGVEAGASAVLQIVRYYEPSDQDQPEQRDLLGWHLGTGVIEFLRRTHAELDVDEYGD